MSDPYVSPSSKVVRWSRFERLRFALRTFVRILMGGDDFAFAEPDGLPERERGVSAHKASPSVSQRETELGVDSALQLLALLQREGRLVDFLEEDVARFSDAEIGAAARVVHSGCRHALREHLVLEAIRAEAEGSPVTVPPAFNPSALRLTGNVQGAGPYAGTLRHKGWRVLRLTLPSATSGHDVRVLAQAEVEL